MKVSFAFLMAIAIYMTIQAFNQIYILVPLTSLPDIFHTAMKYPFLPAAFTKRGVFEGAIAIIPAICLALSFRHIPERWAFIVRRIIIYAAAFMAVVGIWTCHYGMYLVNHVHATTRPFVFFQYPNHAATIMMIAFILALYDKLKISNIAILSILFAGIVWTDCRSAMLLTFACMIMKVFFTTPKTYFIFGAFCVFLGLYYGNLRKTHVHSYAAGFDCSEFTRAIDTRMANWRDAAGMISENPCYGVGWNGFAVNKPIYKRYKHDIIDGVLQPVNESDRIALKEICSGDVNNDYLQYTVEFGFLGVFLMLGAILPLFFNLPLSYGILALVCVGIQAIIDLPFHSIPVNWLCGVVLGMLKPGAIPVQCKNLARGMFVKMYGPCEMAERGYLWNS